MVRFDYNIFFVFLHQNLFKYYNMEPNKVEYIPCLSINNVRQNEGYLYYSEGIVLADNLDLCAQQLRNPKFASMKLDFNVVSFTLHGHAHMVVNGEGNEYEENTISVVPAHSVVSDVMMSPGLAGIIACVTNRMMNQLLGGDMWKWNKLVFNDKITKVNLSTSQADVVRMYWSLLRVKMSGEKDMFHNRVIESIMRAVLYEMLEQVLIGMRDKMGDMSLGKKGVHGEQLFYRFLELLLATSPKFHSIGYYAEMLSITPKYLSDLCKRFSDKPASDWIHEYTLEEIRFYLTKQDLSIKEVARITGFDNSSFFCQYVKHRLGCSPLEFREKALKSEK